MRKLLLAACCFLLLASAHANPYPIVAQDVGVCDPNNPTNCVTPDSSGRLPITSGGQFSASVTPTVQNAAYSSGQSLGGTQTVSVFRTAGGTAILNNVSIWSKGGATTNVTFYIFNSAPSGSTTCTDKTNFVLAAADVSKLITVTPPVLTPHIVGTGTTATTDSWQIPVSISNGDTTTNIYVCAVVGGNVTPGTTTDYVLGFSGLRD